jgi:hypothetical protein
MPFAFYWSEDPATFLKSELTSHQKKLGSNDASPPPSFMNVRYIRNLFDLAPHIALY